MKTNRNNYNRYKLNLIPEEKYIKNKKENNSFYKINTKILNK